jgi:hypothetical protein
MNEIHLLLLLVRKIDERLKFDRNDEKNKKFVGLKMIEVSAT